MPLAARAKGFLISTASQPLSVALQIGRSTKWR
jgi:hypothetical protein